MRRAGDYGSNFAQNNQPISASQTDPKAQAKILDQYGKVPLSFEINQGQTDTQVKFLSRTSGYTLFLTGDEAVLALSTGKEGEDRAVPPSLRSPARLSSNPEACCG